MGLFSKSKKVLPELPPAPSPPERKRIIGDFEPIKPGIAPKEIKPVVVKPAPISPDELKPASVKIEAPELPPAPTPAKFPTKIAPVEIKPEPIKPVIRTEIRPEVYDKTLREAMPERAEILKREPRPIFISNQDYKKILNDSNMIKARLLEAEEFVSRLNALKRQEDELFEKWKNRLEDVEKKLNYVDNILARAK